MRRMSCEHLEAFLPQGCDGNTKEASTRGKRGWNKGAAKGVARRGKRGEKEDEEEAAETVGQHVQCHLVKLPVMSLCACP